jgi:uncharacterized protein YggT (Ycf19 family)
MDPNAVATDEARRVAQHEAVKAKLQADVQARIGAESATSSGSDQAAVKSVAAGLRKEATSEVAEAEGALQRARSSTRVSQVADYAFYLVYGLIGLEIVLELFGARQASGFKRFLDTLTWPLLAPFKGLMPDPAVGSMQLMLSYVVALVVYLLLHMAVNGLLRLFAERKSTI